MEFLSQFGFFFLASSLEVTIMSGKRIGLNISLKSYLLLKLDFNLVFDILDLEIEVLDILFIGQDLVSVE